MNKVLVTGGSGFIGTNLVQSLLDAGDKVLSVDVKEPQNPKHADNFKKVDILDMGLLVGVVKEFEPEHVIHLAARTDLDGKSLDDYRVNTTGVSNLVVAISRQPSIKRCIFASTKLVCKNGYHPKLDEDYCPDTMYGQSKVATEQIIRTNSSLNCQWCIVRPGSIWGPWFDIPYKGFFLAVTCGLYFHPGKMDPPKSFGYVGNIVYQIEKLLMAPTEAFHGRTFYLSDYEQYTIKTWADMISKKTRGKNVCTIPECVVKIAARAGDLLKKLGYRNPPMTSFRLKNMRMDTTGIPLESIRHIAGPLPYSIEQGVEDTIEWLKSQKH